MRTVTVNSRTGQKTVQTDLTVGQAHDALVDSTSSFVQSLRDSYRRSRMSVVQENWLVLIAQEMLDKASQPVVQLGDFAGVIDLFRKAQEHLKYPKIRLALADGRTVQLSHRRQGGVNVANGTKYGDYNNVYYGRVEDNGSFDERKHDPEVIDLLKRLATNPAKVAAEYGALTGNCSFCNLPLTDERSTEVGYGPICAGHYGLPWGSTVTKDAKKTRKARKAS